MIVAVANHKGGVGKTSLTVSLGTALAVKGKRVLVIDNDPQANSTAILMTNGGIPSGGASIADLLDPDRQPPSPATVSASIYPTGTKHLNVIPNTPDTSGLEMEFARQFPDSLSYLRRAIRDYAVAHYDITLIDNPPTLSFFVTQALHAADAVVVPVEAGSSFSLHGLTGILDMVDATQANGNPDLKFLRLLINRVDQRTSVAKSHIEQIRRTFGSDQVFSVIIPQNTAVQQAEYFNETIFKHAPSSRAAKAYRQLALEFIRILER